MFGRIPKPGNICVSEKQLSSSAEPAPSQPGPLTQAPVAASMSGPPEGTELFMEQESRPETPSSRKLTLLPARLPACLVAPRAIYPGRGEKLTLYIHPRPPEPVTTLLFTDSPCHQMEEELFTDRDTV